MIKAYTHLNEILTLDGAHKKDGRHLLPSDVSLIKNGAVAFNEDQILWVGKTEELPSEFKNYSINLQGHVLTPEIVDSHTHLIFGGNRADEYIDRLNGTSYEDIAKRGGGILYTMKKTLEATSDELFRLSCERIERIHSYGVGTIEIKSGYGLTFEKEYELSRLIDRLKKMFHGRVQIFNTYLAAHDVPKNFKSSEDYLNQVVLPLLDKLSSEKIIDAVDIFHEKNYFTTDDVIRLFTRATELSIPCKIHADELNPNDGAQLAVRFDALSADHLLKISDEGIREIAASSTVATLLPGTAFFLGKPLAPARLLLDAGAKVSLASDFNPGSCHCDNLLLIASMAAAQFKMNQAELWAGMTLNASASLGRLHQGAIIPGLQPKFSLFKTEMISEITYNWGRNFSVTLP
jgi:imidazolonepropionase